MRFSEYLLIIVLYTTMLQFRYICNREKYFFVSFRLNSCTYIFYVRCCLNLVKFDYEYCFTLSSLSKLLCSRNWDIKCLLVGMCRMDFSNRDLRIFEIQFESDASDSIRFESDGRIRNFRIGRTCRHTTNYSHCSTKTYNRCAVVIEIYFMFIILAKRDYVTFD